VDAAGQKQLVVPKQPSLTGGPLARLPLLESAVRTSNARLEPSQLLYHVTHDAHKGTNSLRQPH